MNGVRKNVFMQLAALISCAVLMWPIQALPMPTGGNVVAGQATISQPAATTMQIDQASQKAIINWQGFSIDANELVRFVQPGRTAVVLNRVVGADPSLIYGQLQANGQVFVVNNAGILVGAGAKIDVGSFFASTLNISDSDFLAGRYNFVQDSGKNPSYIVNKGTITVSDDGYVILAAPLVSNEGLIIANLGKVNLIGGEKVTVNFDGTGLINFAVDKLPGQPGSVLMTKEAASDIIKNVVNTKGLVEAGSVIEKDGVIELVGASGIVINSGTIKAQGGSAIMKATQSAVLPAGGNVDAKGGNFELSGKTFLLSGSYSASNFLLDPANVLIAEGSGSDPNTYYEDNIESSLNSGTNVTIQAWNSITMLNFTTPGDQGIDATGSGNLTLQITDEDGDHSGTITFSDQNDHISIAGNITLDAQTFATTNGTLQNIGKLTTTAGNINLLASGNIELLNDAQVGGSGVITINSTNGTLTQGANSHISSNATPIGITASNYTMVSGATIDSNGGAVNVNAGNVTINGTITSDNGNINFTGLATGFTIPTGSVNSGTGNVSIIPVAGTTVDLGHVGTGTLQITDATLDNITTSGTLTIGDSNTGNIAIGAVSQPAATVQIVSGGDITDDGVLGTTISASNLTLIADSVGTSAAPLGVDTAGGPITVNTTSGGATGNIYLVQPTGNLLMSQLTLTTDAGSVQTIGLTAAGGAINVDASKTITDNLILIADSMDIANTITGGGSNYVILKPYSTNTGINLGTESGGQLSLTDAEIDKITSVASIQVGDTNSGTLTVSAAITPAGTNTLILVAGDAAGEDITGAGTITVQNLGLSAAGAITLNNIDADNLAAISRVSGNITITDSDDLTVGQVTGAVVGGTPATITGVSTTASDIDIRSAGTLTISNDVVAGNNGNIILYGGTGGTGDVALGANVTSVTSGDIHIKAANAITSTAGIVSGDQVFLDAVDNVGTGSAPIYTNAATLGGQVTAASGGFYVYEANNVTIGQVQDLIGLSTFDGISTNGGNVVVEVGGVLTIVDNLAPNDTIRTSNGTANLIADDITINTAGAQLAVNAGTGSIFISPKTAGRSIDLGTETVGFLSLTDAEIDKLSAAGVLTIGDSIRTGEIAITSDITPAGVTAILLRNEGQSGADIVSNGGRLIEDNIILQAADNIGEGIADRLLLGATTSLVATAGTGSIWIDNDQSVGAATLTANSGVIDIDVSGAGNTLTTGGAWSANAITVLADGNITLGHDLTADVGSISITSTSGIINQTAGDVEASAANQSITYTANDISLAGTTTADATTGVVNFIPNAGVAINIGAGGANFGVSDAELDSVQSALRIEVGNASSGAVTIDGAGITFGPDNVSTLVINTGADINDNGSSNIIDVVTLALNAATGIGNTNTVKVDTGSSTLAARVTGVGNIVINEQTDVVVGDVVANAGTISGLSTFQGSITLTTTNGSITVNSPITAGDNAGTNSFDVTLTATNAGNAADIVIGADITADDDALITAGDTISRPSAGTVTATDLVELDAAAGIGASTNPIYTEAAVLTARTTTSGGIYIYEASAVDIGTGSAFNGINAAANGDIVVANASGDMTVSQNVTTSGTGTITLTVEGDDDTFIHSGGAIDTADQAITITADRMNLSGGTIGSSNEEVTLKPYDTNDTITLGVATDTDFSLSDAELDTINVHGGSGILNIGQSGGGVITIGGNIDVSGDADILHLWSGGSITGANTITGNDLAVSSTDAGNIDINTIVTTVAAVTNNGDITIEQQGSNNLIVGTVDGVNGVNAGGSNVVISTVDGNITINGDVSAAGTGTITITSGDSNYSDGTAASILTNNADITTNNGAITLVADQMTLDGAGASIVAGGTNTVTLKQYVNTGSGAGTILIDLGGSDAFIPGPPDSVTLGLTDAELDTITASQITIGASNGANIDNTAAVGPNNVSTMLLVTGGTIDNPGAGAGSIEVANLALDAVNGIGTTNSIHTIVTNVAAYNSTSGNIRITEAATGGDINIGSVAGIVGVHNSNGNVDIRTTDGTIYVSQPVIANVLGADIILSANTLGNTADIVIGANITATDDVHLKAANAITRTAGVVSGDQVFLDAGDNVGTGAAPIYTNAVTLGGQVTGAGGGFNVYEANNVTIGQVQDLIGAGTFDGISTNGGGVLVSLIQAGTTLTVVDNLGSDTIRTGGGVVRLEADEMTINSGGAQFAINSGAGDVYLAPATAGTTIDLGVAVPGTYGLELDNNELNEISSSGIVVIGNGLLAKAGVIHITANISPTNFADMALVTGDTGAGTTAITDETAGSGGNKISLTGTLTFDTPRSVDITTAVSTIAGQSTTAGDIRIDEDDGITVGSGWNGIQGLTTTASDITLVTINGSITVNQPVSAAGSGKVTLTAGGAASDIILNNNALTQGGEIELNADNDVKVNNPAIVRSHDGMGGNAGLIDINADADGSGAGELQVAAGATVDSDSTTGTDANIEISAADFDAAGGTIDAGSAKIYIFPSTSAPIDLGGAGAATFSVTAADLLSITQADGGLILGYDDSGATIYASNISLSANFDVNTATWPLTLVTSGSITGGNFLLTAPANLQLTLDTVSGISGTTGVGGNALNIDADFLAAIATNGNIYIYEQDGVTITSSQNASRSWDGVITDAGSNGNIALQTAANSLVINKPIDADGTGNILLQADASAGTDDIDINAAISSDSGTITILAADNVYISDSVTTASLAGATSAGITITATSGNVEQDTGSISTNGGNSGIAITAGTDVKQTGGNITSSAFVTVSAGRDITIDPITAQTFIDLRADDDIIITGDLTATTSHVYMRANNDGILVNDGDTGVYAGGNVVFDGTNGAITITASDNTNGLVLVIGENIYSLANNASDVTINANGVTSSGTGDGLLPGYDFSVAFLASTDIGSVTNPVLLTVNAPNGNFVDIADQDLRFDGQAMNFSHSIANHVPPHLGFNDDLLGPDGIGSIHMDPTSVINAGLDAIYQSPDPIILGDTHANRHIIAVSTGVNGYVQINDNSTVQAGLTDMTGDVRLISRNSDIIVGDNVTILTGVLGDIVMVGGGEIITGDGQLWSAGNRMYLLSGAPTTAGNDIGGFTFGAPAPDQDTLLGTGTFVSGLDYILIDATGDLGINGSINPGSYIDFETGTTTGTTGSFTLGPSGNLNLKGSLTIGGSAAGNNIHIIQNPLNVVSPVVTIAGTIGGSGAIPGNVTVDLDSANIQGDILFTGRINATGNVTLTTDADTAAYDIIGGGSINSQNGWILVDAGNATNSGDIIIGSLTAGANNTVSGYAIELETPAGDVTVNGSITANSASGLNVAIDPVDVTINSPVNITGNLDVWATNDITVNANITSSGGNIRLYANSTDLTPTADDNAGDFVAAAGTSITANNGYVSIRGVNVTVRDITAGTAVGIASDFATAASGGKLTLDGTIYGVGGVNITGFNGVLDVALAGDSTIKSTGAGSIQFITDSLDGNYNLTIQTGSGAIALGEMGSTTPLNSLAVSTTGTATLNGNITTTGNLNLSGAGTIALGNNITLTTATGDLRVNGTNGVTGAQSLALNSTTGNIYIGTVGGGVTGLSAATGGVTYLGGNITTAAAGTGIDLGGSAGIDLQSNVTLTSNNQQINLGSTNQITETGNRTLTLVAGTGAITLNDVDITNLSITSGGSNTLYGDIIVDNPVNFANAGNTTLGGDVTVTTSNDAVTFAAIDGGFNLGIDAGKALITLGAVGGTTPVASLTTNSGTIALNGAITAAANGNISITTTGSAGDITINNNISTSGAGTIELTSSRDVLIGTGASATVSAVNGDVTITGRDITLGTGANTGVVTTSTGSGNIKLDASRNVAVNTGSSITSGGWLDIDPTSITNVGTMSAVNYITISATGQVQNTGTISTSGANSYVVIDAGSIVQNGDITTPTGGNEYVSLTATGAITDTNDGTTDITTQSLYILGASSVGGSAANAALDTDVANLYVVNVAGNTYISEKDSVTVTGVNVTGNFVLTAVGTPAITTTGNIVSSAGLVDLAGAVNLGANVLGGAGVELDNVTLTADVVVASANGYVNFGGTINGAYDLTANAASTVTFGGIVGGTTGINDLLVSAGTLIDVNAAIQDANTITFNGNSDLGANLTATNGNIVLNGNVTLSGGARTLTASAAGADILVNGDISAAQNLTLTANDVVSLTTIGALGADPTLLDVNATTALLGGDITVDGSVDLSGTTTTTLVNNIIIDISGAGSVDQLSIGTLNGGKSLTIIADDSDVSLGAITQLTGLTVTSADEINLNGAINIPGAIALTSTTGTDVNGGITGANAITITGPATLSADVTATNNILFNNGVTIDSSTRSITSTNGNITFVGDITGNQILNLSATSGNVSLAGVNLTGTTGFDIDALTAVLNGNITVAGNIDLSGVVTTTVGEDITIDGSGATTGTITLARITGNHNLQITQGADDDVIFGGDVTALTGLTVTNADDIDVGGAINIQGSVLLTAADTINVNRNINSGGLVGLTGDKVNVNANIGVTGNNSLGIQATDITIAGTSDAALSSGSGPINLIASNSINIGTGAARAEILSTSGGSLNADAPTVSIGGSNSGTGIWMDGAVTIGTGGTDTITVGDGVFGIQGRQNVYLTAKDSIDIYEVVRSTNGDVYLTTTQTTVSGDITLENGSSVTGKSVNLNAANDVIILGNQNNNLGTITLTAGNQIQLGANVQALQDVVFDSPVLLTANADVTSNIGNVTFADDISGAFDLTVTALLGTATFDTIGAGTHPTSLTVNAKDVVFGNTANIDGQIDVTAQNNIVIDELLATTNNSSNINLTAAKDVLIGSGADGTVQAIDGLITITGTNVYLGLNGNAGVIETTGTGDIKLDVSGNLVMNNNSGTEIVSGGWINIDPINVVIDGAGLTAAGDIDITADNTITVNADITAGGNATLTSGVSITQNSGTISGVNDILTSGTITLAGDIVSTGDITITAQTGVLTLIGDIDSGNNVNLLALASSINQESGDITAGGMVVLYAGDNITISGTIGNGSAIGGDIVFTGPNKITVEGTDFYGVGGNININGDIIADGNISGVAVGFVNIDADITSNSGDVGFVSGTGIILTTNSAGVVADGDINLLTSGLVDINADLTSNSGDISITGLTMVEQGTGTGTITANQNVEVYGGKINLDDVVAGNDVNIEGIGNVLLGSVSAGTNIDVLSGNAVAIYGGLTAGTGYIDVGAISDILVNGDVDAGTSVALVSNNGSISQVSDQISAGTYVEISAAQDVNLIDVTALANNGATGYAIKVTADGNVNVANLDASGGTNTNIGIDPTNVTVNGPIIASGNIDITADNTITVNADITADSDGDNTGDANLTATTGSIAQASGTTISGENVLLVAGDNLNLNEIQAATDITALAGQNIVLNDNLTAGDLVDIISLTGSITQVGGLITADELWLTASTGIGNELLPIQTDVNNLTAISTGGVIAVENDTDLVVDQATNAGNPVLISADGTLTIAGNITGSDVTLESTNDEITQTGGLVTSTNLATLDAATGITLTNAELNKLDAYVSGTGNITITEATDIMLISVYTDDGSITVTTTNGTITAVDVNATEDVNLTANGSTKDIIITGAGITAGDDVTLISSDTIVGGKITADKLTATASGVIDIQTDITTLEATTSNSNITVVEDNTLALDDINAGTGDVSLTVLAGTLASNAGKYITANDLVVNSDGAVTINTHVDTLAAMTNNAAITVDEDDDLALNLVDAGNGDITLTVGGAITDNNGASLNIKGQNLILVAVDGIGSGNALETQVTNLDAGNTNNNIEIANTGALILLDLDASGNSVLNVNGQVIISAASPLTVSSPIAGGAGVTLTAGEIADAGTWADDLTVNANISSANGSILLRAGDDITVAAGTIVQAQLLGQTMTLIAGYQDQDSGGAITSSGTLLTNSGDIVLSAIGNIAVWTVNAGTGDVDITSSQGNVTGGKITADELDVASKTGINITTAVNTLTAGVSGDGNIVVGEDDGITLANVTTADGAISVTTTNGTIIATYVVAGDAGNDEAHDVTLTANGAGNDIVIDYLNADNNALLTAADAIFDNGDSSVDVEAVGLVATATAGNINLDTNINNLTATAGTTIQIDDLHSLTVAGTVQSTGGGNITITANGNIALAADITTTGDVTLIADNNNDHTGSITMTSGTISGNDLVMSAGSGIGNGGAIVTAVDTLTATNTTSGDIWVQDTNGNLAINTVDNGNRPVRIESAGAITDNNAGANNITSGDLVLVAVNGIDLDTTSNRLNAYNSTSGDINIYNIGDLIIDDFAGVSANNWGVENRGGAVIIETASSILIPGTSGDGIYASGSVTLTASSDIRAGSSGNGITAVEANNGGVTLNAGGNIYLGESGYADVYADNSGDIVFNANNITLDNYTWVEAESGDITFNADGTISVITRAAGEPTRILADGGAISLNADNGDINIVGGSSVEAVSLGDVELIAANNINIEGSVVISDEGNLYILSDGYVNITNSYLESGEETYIYGNDAGVFGDVTIVGSEIQADGNMLDIQAGNNVSISNSYLNSGYTLRISADNGNVTIEDSSGVVAYGTLEVVANFNLDITGGSYLSGYDQVFLYSTYGNIGINGSEINSDNGVVNIDAGNNVTITDTTTYSYDDTYIAAVDGSVVIGNSGIETDNGVYLYAGQDITVTDIAYINAAVHAELLADGGSVVINNASSVNAGDDVYIEAGDGDVSIGFVTAGDLVTINAAGAIKDNNGDTLNIVTTDLVMSAVNGIGLVNDPIDTQVSTLTATNTTTGDIVITNNKYVSGDLVINRVHNTGAGSVIIRNGDIDNKVNGGVIILGNSSPYIAPTLLATNSVELYAIGAIVDRNNEIDADTNDPSTLDIQAGGTSVLYSYEGWIGEPYNPIEIAITDGHLYVYAGGLDPQTNLTSVNLTGTIVPYGIPEAYEGLVPPGLILFNYRVVGGSGQGGALVPPGYLWAGAGGELINYWNTSIAQDNMGIANEPGYFYRIMQKVLLGDWFEPEEAPYSIDEALRQIIEGIVLLK
ncbi:MAG: filamentous hemagglutinin N-terminal domain-containing protein [Candidatus Omnitrophica bacterium]|nr:filamentous hemagglutinin N-terminal domain-containing protein [Candidatus Omnitrophota bacterium]